MFKPNESLAGRDKLHGLRIATMTAVAAIAVTGLLLPMPFGATAGIAAGTGDRLASHDPPPSAAPNARAPATYQLRCWQYGRLLFDEGPVTLGAETRQAAKVVAIDRHGSALIVTDTGAATCLARPFAAAPNPGLPR